MGNAHAPASVMHADAVALVESVLHGRRPPSPRAIDALRAADLPADPASWTAAERVRAAARIMALSRLGQTDAAAELARLWRDVPLPAPGGADQASVVLGLGAAVVEAAILDADTGPATGLAARLVANALDLGDPSWVYRSRALLAAASALHRDQEQAERQQRAMRALAETEGWTADVTDPMGELGEAALAMTALDAGRLARVSARLHRMLAQDATLHALSQTVDAAQAVVAGDRHRTTALASRIAQGAEDSYGGELLRRCALQLQSFSLITGDEPIRALGLLRQAEAARSHLWCPHLLRAAAHLRAGDPRSALGVTTECVRIRPRHNLHTLASVLLLRGLAHLRLQMTDLGIREIGDAMALLGGSVPAATLALLHPIDHGLLRARLERLDGAAAVLAALRDGAGVVTPAEQGSGGFPVLTPRERAVAEQLRLPRTFPEIAASLHVAPSTVKTQALSIYKKLRVSARADAVGLLEQAGYFEL